MALFVDNLLIYNFVLVSVCNYAILNSGTEAEKILE